MTNLENLHFKGSKLKKSSVLMPNIRSSFSFKSLKLDKKISSLRPRIWQKFFFFFFFFFTLWVTHTYQKRKLSRGSSVWCPDLCKSFSPTCQNSVMKCYIPYESPYAKDSKSIHCLVLVAMVTMQGLWLAKHENGCNSKTKSRIGFIIGGLVDENIPEGLMEPDFYLVAMATGSQPIRWFCLLIQI